MSIYEAVGMIWIILTSAMATIAFFYLAYVGLKYKLEPATIHTETVVDVDSFRRVSR